MAKIHVLDKHTAELIAAGEVVERPASVAKELLENAIDAGSAKIELQIQKGGIALIQVSDDGCGIEAESIATAFIRHATSKIQSQTDLEHIATLGFRGEALASISSVARVEVLTCTEQDEFACNYYTEGGQEVGMKPGARPVGTTITVRDLFYNTPARMKFLKKDSSEGTYVTETATRLALSHPEISFRYMREGKVQFHTPGDGTLRSAVYAVLGRQFAKDLLEVQPDDRGPYRVSGLITPPGASRASRSMQYFYINGRFVKNRTMMAALENAYKGTVMQGKFPGCVLMLEMPAELVDVNVHPAKTEVRFAHEHDVFEAVYRAVKIALTAPGSGENQFSFEKTKSKVIPQETTVKQNTFTQEKEKADNEELRRTGLSAFPAADLSKPAGTVSSIYGGTISDVKANAITRKSTVMHSTAEPYTVRPTDPQPPKMRADARPQGFNRPREDVLDILVEEPEQLAQVQPAEQGKRELPGVVDSSMPENQCEQTVAQGMIDTVKDATEVQSGGSEEAAECVEDIAPNKTDSIQPMQLAMEKEPEIEPLQYIGEAFKTYIITQRGHELCLIDKHAAHERILYERLAKDYGHVSSQMLLAPVTISLSAEEKIAVMQNLQLLMDAGVEAEDFGGNTVVVRAVPADVEIEDVEDLVVELAAKLARGSKDAYSEQTEWVLHSIACRAAIKAGDHTAPQQLMHLAEDILAGKVPPFCPHGRPVVLKLTQKELEKQFGRIV